MKRFLLIILMFVPLCTMAQTGNNITLLEEGKTWHYTYYNWATGKRYTFEEKITGDTIIDGRTYMKYHNDDGGVTPLREEPGKVYFYSNRSKKDELLYDFTLSLGDKVETWDAQLSDVTGTGLWVTDVGYVTFNGQNLKAITISGTEWVNVPGRCQVWVEGMGSDGGLLVPFPASLTGGFVFLDYIETADGSTFSFNNIAAIETPEVRSAHGEATYDLQGRQVSNRSGQLPKGIYIRGGKKFVR